MRGTMARMQDPPALDASALEQLVSTRMPFGKHEGTVLADLPGNYLNWFAREGFPKGEMGRLLALMQLIDHNGLRPMLDPLRHQPPQRAALRSYAAMKKRQ